MRKTPTNGNWASSSIKLVEKYDLNLKEIQYMKTSIYKKLVKRQMHTIACKELLEIQKSKEKENILNMTAFKSPTPFSQKQSSMFQKKLDLFALRTEMNLNSYNFGKKIYCEKRMPKRANQF